jgi:hypothetical protein
MISRMIIIWIVDFYTICSKSFFEAATRHTMALHFFGIGGLDLLAPYNQGLK